MRWLPIVWTSFALAATCGFSGAARAERLVLVAGGKSEVSQEPVAATSAKLDAPFGVDFNRQGTLFLVEMKGQRVREIDPSGELQTIAGTGKQGATGDDGPALRATFNGSHNLVVAPNDEIYIADTWNNRIRKIDPAKRTIHAFAGTGTKGFGGDGGPASQAEFGGVYCIALAPGGEMMYVADLDNRRIRSVNMKTGVVDTVAGDGSRGAPEDGADAKRAPLVDPRAVAADGEGNVYILERSGNALRVVDPRGRIRTLIGPGAEACTDETGKQPLRSKGPSICASISKGMS